MLHDNSIPAAAHDSYGTESYKSSCLEGTRTQHIDDITAWTTSIDQLQKHRLLCMVQQEQGNRQSQNHVLRRPRNNAGSARRSFSLVLNM